MRVRFFAYLRKFTGCAEADVPYEVLAAKATGRGSPPVTAGALARALCEMYGTRLQEKLFPADGSGGPGSKETFGPEIIFLINGRHVSHLGGQAAPLNPDDRVDIFPVVAGG